MKIYCPVVIVLDEQEFHCLWYTNDIDGLLTRNNRLVHFRNRNDLNAFCALKTLTLEDGTSVYHPLKAVHTLLDESVAMDYVEILNFWNLSSDLASSLRVKFLGDHRSTNNLYNKVFYGNNLPSLRRDGEEYVPQWDEDEREALIKIMSHGLEILQNSLSHTS